jgi:hypothetical protein
MFSGHDTPSASIDDAIRDCVSASGYSGLWTMLALASLLRRKLISHYPTVNGGSDKYAICANMAVVPCAHPVDDAEPFHLLWTRFEPPDGTIWRANHIVPLIPVNGECSDDLSTVVGNQSVDDDDTWSIPDEHPDKLAHHQASLAEPSVSRSDLFQVHTLIIVL